MLTVCFAGLPSAGKSTTINALAGKRVLESGVCRTTTEPCLVGATNTVGAQKWVQTKLESDDGVEFRALDLPGICDAEDASGAFDAVTLEWATKCDVVVWVTDARTAFLTTHEKREYASVRDAIQEKADEDGTLYQFCILLAKYDVSANDTNTGKDVGVHMHARFLEGEIRTAREETTIDGSLERVTRTFPETRVVKFSAFARIANSGSETLRALVSARSQSTDGTNAAFDLRWATENLVEKRFAQMTRVLRSTRQRAVAAETRLLDVEIALASMRSELRMLSLRVAPSPVYDTRIELEVVKPMIDPSTGRLTCDPRTGAPVGGIPVYSFTMTMDAAVTAGWPYERRPVSTKMGRVEILFGMQSHHMNNITQIIAPTVRPVYGDVILVPAHFHGFGCNGAHGECAKLVIYAGSDVGDKYALKVGEVNRYQVAGLIAALTGKSGCFVGRKGTVKGTVKGQ